MERTKDRFYYLDYLRGFMVLLVVLDHAMHAYSQHYADYWFMSDVDRSVFIDVLHMQNDVIMMPFLLALAGLFTMHSLTRRGLMSFIKERVLRLGTAFVFGVSVVAGFLAYNRAIFKEGYLGGFLNFYLDTYWSFEKGPFGNFIMGSFWFIYYLALLTVVLLILRAVLPWVIRLLGKFMTFVLTGGVWGYVTLGILSAIILGASDFVWGAPWWFGFKPVFFVRRARFLMEGLYFFLGVGAFVAGALKDPALLKRLTDQWGAWVLVTFVTGGAYTWFSLTYFYDGAYTHDTAIILARGGSLGDALEVAKETSLMPLLRTTLLGFYMTSLSGMYLAVFGKFLNTPKPFWMALAASSFGIYIFHEPFALWVHVHLFATEVPTLIKFVLAAGVSLGASWALTVLLKKIKGVDRVL
ncbi:MAG: hypothetical protein C0514_05350 [Candidatus Puniceispirillum sp.]|nr:hypothetical protein [Candidatus Puniceispirillum sp.]